MLTIGACLFLWPLPASADAAPTEVAIVTLFFTCPKEAAPTPKWEWVIYTPPVVPIVIEATPPSGKPFECLWSSVNSHWAIQQELLR